MGREEERREGGCKIQDRNSDEVQHITATLF